MSDILDVLTEEKNDNLSLLAKTSEPGNKVLSELKTELSQPKFKVLSGFGKIDDSIGGFKSGQTFVIGGLKKSGKSSLLMNLADYWIKTGERVGFLNTELGKGQFFQRLSGIASDMLQVEVEKSACIPIDWLGEVKDNFYYAEKADIKDDNGLSLTKTIALFKDWVFAGTKIIILDNLTTFSTGIASGKKGWEILAHTLDTLIDFAKENQIILFVVIHTKDGLVFTETPAGIQKLISDKEPEKIFEKSVTINRRPTSGDLYGGGASKSQVSGGILLLWRPYQDFALEEYKRITMLILEDFRDGAKETEIRLEFDGSKLRFNEYLTAEEIFNAKK